VNALYRYHLETGSVDKLYQHDTYDIEFLIPDFADRDVAGVRVYAVKPEYHWLDPENATAKTYGELQRAFPGQSLFITSVTDDERIAIVYVSSDTNPGDYYKLDRSARKVDYIMPSRGWVDPAKMSHVEAVAFQARDGVALHGYLTRPKDAPGPYPLIVLPHGGPHLVRDTWEFDPEVQLLAHHGYAVLQVDFRGSGGYGLPFSRSGYRQWGATMQDDLTDATRWAVAQGITTDDNICIYGSSFGGYAALMGAAREPTLYRCAAGGFGVYDLELMFERGDTQASEWGEEYLEDVLGTDPESLRARSPAYLADRIQAPVLLIHGQEDWRADISHATRMRSALERAGKNVTWLALAGEGHGIYNEKNREEAYGTLLAFFGKHLRQSGPSSASQEAATGSQ
jgi:dipeptidyl aminopeptidase/acylaminoacyl peptidase